MSPRSFRGRLAISTVLWTIVLVGITNAVILGLLLHRFADRWIHFAAMSVVALGLLVAGLLQIRSLLAPFRDMQSRLTAVREGRETRVLGEYPLEVQPLVRDLNELLGVRERMVERALAKAGDLAHGLKTPLAVLAHESERLSAKGDHESAALVSQQIERMRRQIEHHLAHARAQAGRALPGTSTPVADAVDGLVRTLGRIHVDKGLAFEATIDRAIEVAVAREDFEEILGNILDNASKWGRRQIVVRAANVGPAVEITVDDDGPGIPPEMRDRVLQRGVRADEAAPGSGLGLSIVSDLVETYAGKLAIETSPRGGTRVIVGLPAAGPGGKSEDQPD